MMPSRGMGAMKPNKMSGKSSRPAVGKTMAKGGKVKKLAVGGPATPPAPPVTPAQATTPPAPPVSPAQPNLSGPAHAPAARPVHQPQRPGMTANARANYANQITKLKQEQLRQQNWGPGSANSLNPTPGMKKGGKVKKFAAGGEAKMTTMERRITEMDKPTRPAPPAAKKPMPKKPSDSPPIPDRLLRGESEDKAPGERGYKKYAKGGVVKNMPTANQMGTLGMAKGGKAKPNWIKGAIKKPGALRASLGAKPGKPIPAGKLDKAAKAPGKLGQRARFAKVLKGFKRK